MAKVLIIGSGGREHALGWKLKSSPNVTKLYFASGNAGTAKIGENIEIEPDEIDKLTLFAGKNAIDLTVVGKETPLEGGIANVFKASGLPIFGPTKEAALLETDKGWATSFMERHNIPHPYSKIVKSYEEALDYIKEKGVEKIVIKATGLAGGKGVFLPQSLEDAEFALKRIITAGEFGPFLELVIQERIFGREISFHAFCDGKTIAPLLGAQDHKRVNDSDQGPNTGGMGAFAPCPMDDKLKSEIIKTILEPTIKGMSDEGHSYSGVLYAGLMVTDAGPKVIEYNARFGDPETQPLMMLLESDLFEILKSCSNGTLNQNLVSFKSGSSLCVVLASGGYPGSFEKEKEIFGLDERNDPDLQIFHAGTKEENGKLLTSGGRVLGVCAYGRDMDEARKRAYLAIGDGGIHFEGMHFRHDIGTH